MLRADATRPSSVGIDSVPALVLIRDVAFNIWWCILGWMLDVACSYWSTLAL
jgi:hypothetical protein